MWDRGRTGWRHQIKITAAIFSSISDSQYIWHFKLRSVRAHATWTDFITAVSELRLKRAIISPHWWITQQPSLKSVLIVKTKKMSGVCGEEQAFTATPAGNFPTTDNRQWLKFTSSFYPRVQMSGCHSNLPILLQMSDWEVRLWWVHQGDDSGEDLNADKSMKGL